MKITQDELIEILSDVTTLLGQALAQHVELNESVMGAGAGVEVQQKKLELLQTKLAHEKMKLVRLKRAAQRKKTLEKKRAADRQVRR